MQGQFLVSSLCFIGVFISLFANYYSFDNQVGQILQLVLIQCYLHYCHLLLHIFKFWNHLLTFYKKSCWDFDWTTMTDSMINLEKTDLFNNSGNFYPWIPSLSPFKSSTPFNLNVIFFSRKSSYVLLYLFLGILFLLLLFPVVSFFKIIFLVCCRCRVCNYFCILILFLAILLNNWGSLEKRQFYFFCYNTYTDAPGPMMGLRPNKFMLSLKYPKLKMHLIN